MSAIEASTYTSRVLVDGTLAITLHIEPAHAQDAFRMFCKPGTPLAIAALKTAAQQQPEPPKGGPLSQWLAMRCKEKAFQDWLDAEDEAEAIEKAKWLCDVQSRAEIDNNPQAKKRFEQEIRQPWLAHTGGTI